MIRFPLLEKLKILTYEPHWIMNNERVCKAEDIEKLIRYADVLYGIKDPSTAGETWIFKSLSTGKETHTIRALGLAPIKKGVSKEQLLAGLRMMSIDDRNKLADRIEKEGIAD